LRKETSLGDDCVTNKNLIKHYSFKKYEKKQAKKFAKIFGSRQYNFLSNKAWEQKESISPSLEP